MLMAFQEFLHTQSSIMVLVKNRICGSVNLDVMRYVLNLGLDPFYMGMYAYKLGLHAAS